MRQHDRDQKRLLLAGRTLGGRQVTIDVADVQIASMGTVGGAAGLRVAAAGSAQQRAQPVFGGECRHLGKPAFDRTGDGDRGAGKGPDAKPYRGKLVRLKAAIRISPAGASDRAQMWFRVDREGRKMGFFNNMGDRPIRNQQWNYYKIEGDIDGGAIPGGGLGRGAILVDADYGGEGRLCYRIQGIPVDNAEITFYLLSDFNLGKLASDFIVASSRTRVDGAWIQPVMLDPADYALVFQKQGEAGPDSFALSVTDDPADSTIERISPPPPQATISDDCVIEGLDAFGGNGTILVDQDFGGPGALTWELDGVAVTGGPGATTS
ncbi:MAG: hypothetical protein IH805_01585 [Proteobacteria bacterium]|nr:hypothetical protein [Pseudomonadota bacterium]